MLGLNSDDYVEEEGTKIVCSSAILRIELPTDIEVQSKLVLWLNKEHKGRPRECSRMTIAVADNI